MSDRGILTTDMLVYMRSKPEVLRGPYIITDESLEGVLKQRGVLNWRKIRIKQLQREIDRLRAEL